MNVADDAPDERLSTQQIAPPRTRPIPGPPSAGEMRPGAQAGQHGKYPAGEPSPVTGAGERNRPGPGREPGAALLQGGELQRIVIRWREIQAHFVDEPRTAVERADALVADLMQQLAAMFARERTELEQRWADGDGVSTEELRQSLRSYRSLFERLLNA